MELGDVFLYFLTPSSYSHGRSYLLRWFQLRKYVVISTHALHEAALCRTVSKNYWVGKFWVFNDFLCECADVFFLFLWVNFFKIVTQNAGNRISGVIYLEIFLEECPRTTLLGGALAGCISPWMHLSLDGILNSKGVWHTNNLYSFCCRPTFRFHWQLLIWQWFYHSFHVIILVKWINLFVYSRILVEPAIRRIIKRKIYG